VAASGGQPQPVTTLDRERGDSYHSWPQLLQNGRYLYFVRTEDAKSNGVYVGRLDSPETTRVLSNPSRAVYASEHLLWVFEDRLVAQAFDSSRLQLSGDVVTLALSVFQGAGRTAAFWASDSSLVYAVGGSPERQFRWVSRSGASLGEVGPPGLYVTFDMLPDGSRVVAEVTKPGATVRSTLSILDTTRRMLSAATLGDNNDSDPRFGPHGDIAFARNSGNAPGIMKMDPSGGSQALMVPRGKLPVVWLEDWTGDAGSLVYRSGADRDAWQLLAGTPEPRRLTDAREPVDQVQLSPDSKWIAYNSAESGRLEVYLSPVPANGQRWQISVDGGVQAIWRGDGRELYYLGLDGGMYGVDIKPGAAGPQVGQARLLFRTSVPVISAVVEQYRVTSDGERFLFCLPLTSVQREPLRMVLNWPAKFSHAR
jgi:hypothetical protein